MKHCYTDCTVVSDDEYRTRYDCKVCKKSFYQLKNRTSQVESVSKGTHKDSLNVGTMVLVNGSPHVTCGWCTQSVRLHDVKPIRVLLKWEMIGQKYERIGVNNFNYLPAVPGQRYVVPQYKPVIKSVHGCIECQHIQAIGGKQHYFGKTMPVRMDQPVDTSVLKVPLKDKPDVEVRMSGVFPSGETAGTQKCWSTLTDEEV